MGGQTGLKGALELAGEGVRKKFECELIGANEYAIDLAEDRSKFRDAMTEIGLGSARSDVAHTMDEARRIQQDIGFPVIKIGRAHVCTPVTNAHLECRLLLEKKKLHQRQTSNITKCTTD